jgi:catechol 2,3-dioxygenase-like lactoylglutathione lyase family enzyme
LRRSSESNRLTVLARPELTIGARQTPVGQAVGMIFGSHFVLFSNNADADRAFLADVLGFEHVDAGGGWLIFGLPPAEAAIHPAAAPGAELYFMCDDLAAEMRTLAAKDVPCSDVEEARWGSLTKIRLPGGGEVGLYEPRHAAMVERR